MENVNGGEVTPIEVVDSTEDLSISSAELDGKEFEKATEVMNNLTAREAYIKKPIFLGHVDPELVKSIEELIDPNLFEIAILPPSVQQSCEQAYNFSKLGVKEKDNMLKVRNDIESRKSASDSIIEIEKMFKDLFKQNNTEVGSNETISFKPYELKNIVTVNRGEEISVAATRQMIEFLQIHGFLVPTLLNTPFHKQQFAITIDDVTRLNVYYNIVNSIDSKIFDLERTRKLYDDEILKLSETITKEVDGDDALGDDALNEQKIEQVNDGDTTDNNGVGINATSTTKLTEKQKKVLELICDCGKDVLTVQEISQMYNNRNNSISSNFMQILSDEGFIKIIIDIDTNKKTYKII